MKRKTPSKEMTAFAELIRENRAGNRPDSIAEMRANMEAQQAQLPIPDDVETKDLTISGVPCRFVTAGPVTRSKVLLYLHGGGYVMGSLDTHKELMARLSRATASAVLGVDYRLAPEHPWPAAVEDVAAVYEELVAELEPTQLMIGGDSAGGGLALATMLELKKRSAPLPAGAILFSPWTDLSASGESIESRAEVEPMIDVDNLKDMAELYYTDNNPKEPTISPLFGDLKGFPPLLIQVGDHEVLLDDATRLAEAAKKQWVVNYLEVYPGAFHVFQAAPGVPEAAEAIESAAKFFLKRVTVPQD